MLEGSRFLTAALDSWFHLDREEVVDLESAAFRCSHASMGGDCRGQGPGGKRIAPEAS